MQKNLSSAVSIAALLLLSGCISVDISKLDSGKHDIKSCANIYVQDLRPYVVSKKKEPDFVGIVRGGYGNPWDFTTGSGESLASQLGKSIQASLSGGNEKAALQSGSMTKTSSDGCKTVVLTMREWKIDSTVNAWFYVDADMEVYSGSGKLLASKATKRKDAVSGSYFTAVGDAKKNFIKESEKSLSELLTSVSSAI